jgi:transposase, IS30 family
MACHLTFQEGELLYRLSKKGKSKTEIADVMGRDRSTIYRELSRNSRRGGYKSERAQRLADRRRLACRRPRKLGDADAREYVRARLEKRWSPEQIAGRRQRDCPRWRSRWFSRQTIYNWIDEEAPHWRRWLRHGGRRYGDWEGDTVVGKGRRNALVTLVERKSGYARIGLAENLKAPTTRHVTVQRMKGLPASLRRSITFDNGKEFAEHQQLSRSLELEVYFALPYRSWRRGAHENTNGLLRQFFPKGTDFSRISRHEVARVEPLLNERPRKRLGYRTPPAKSSRNASVAIET